jgi:hypothetical protein
MSRATWEGRTCLACKDGADYLCRRCYAMAKRGQCPGCFTLLASRMEGRRKVVVHPATGCPVAEGAPWHDRGLHGMLDERPRIIVQVP